MGMRIVGIFVAEIGRGHLRFVQWAQSEETVVFELAFHGG